MKNLANVMALLVTLPAASAQTAPPTTTKVAEGLYLVEGAGEGGSVAFYVGSDGVLVIDSGDSRASGKKVIEAVRSKSSKPIRYLVLTHYHLDHTLGMQSFGPETLVVGQENLAGNLVQVQQRALQELPADLDKMRANLEELKKGNGNAEERAEAEKALAAAEATQRELKAWHPAAPAIEFDRKLVIHLGTQTIEVIHPGPTHTNCSSIVVFRNLKVAHLGDMMFVGSHPYIDPRVGASVRNWIDFLRRLQGEGLERVIPGHGPVSAATDIGDMIQYLEDLRAEVQAAIDRGLTLEDAKEIVRMPSYNTLPRPDRVPIAVEAVFRELTSSQKSTETP